MGTRQRKYDYQTKALMSMVALRLKLSPSWDIIYICTVKIIILAPWLTRGQDSLSLAKPKNERRQCHVKRREDSKSGNWQDQQEGSKERYSGDWEIQHVVEEDCGGFEETTRPA